jgi:hypothetical protein
MRKESLKVRHQWKVLQQHLTHQTWLIYQQMQVPLESNLRLQNLKMHQLRRQISLSLKVIGSVLDVENQLPVFLLNPEAPRT